MLRGRQLARRWDELAEFVTCADLHQDSLFSIGGMRVRIDSHHRLAYPASLETFRASGDSWDLRLSVTSESRLPSSTGEVIYEGASHWRAKGDDHNVVYEMFYPPTATDFCHMIGNGDRSHFSLVFGRENLDALGEVFEIRADSPLWFPYPFDQLAMVPALARRGGFLVHACGAAVDGKAYVFAGHSGDGKTTLSRLLAAEGVELLSDERVAIRHVGGCFVAYGTPWHGEGNIVSSASYPLGGVFVLRKGPAHRIVAGSRVVLAAELLSRSIVPYYLAEEAALILSLVERLTGAVPLRQLEFSLEPGLDQVLSEAARSA